MTKQEEIREGIKVILEKYGVRSLSFKHDDWDFNRDEFAEKLMYYLHSQGVVIKVNRELPPIHQDQFQYCDEAVTASIETQKIMLKVGYVAVEPLIKEAIMTKEEILAMEAGRNLDAFIAIQVFGDKIVCGTHKGLDLVLYDVTEEEFKQGMLPHRSVPQYSTDISATWQVVEKMEMDGYGHKHLRYSQGHHEGVSKEVSWIFMQPGFGIFEAIGKTILEAICKAALLTKLEEEGKS